MSRVTVKYCFVLSCLNNSKKNPEKYYFRVPYNQELRDKWCLAVGRTASSIKQSSTAYCCSDHFDMEEDLDRFASCSGCPKIRNDALPSLKHVDTQARNAKAMEVIDIFGPDILNDESTTKDEELPPDNIYIREVVYIEENDNNQFLQEALESDVDCLNVSCAMENSPTKAVVEISDDKHLLGAVASAIKTSKPTESLVKYKIPPKSIVSVQRSIDKNKNLTGVTSPNKKQIKLNLNQYNGQVVANTKSTKTFESKNLVKLNNNERSLALPRNKVLLKFNNLHPLNGIDKLTTKATSTCQVKNVLSTSTAKPKATVATTALIVRNCVTPANSHIPGQKVVNPFKYTNYKEFTKLQNQHNSKNNSQSDDDDCILLDEQSGANEIATVSPTSQNPSNNALARLPTSISVREFSNIQMASSPATNAIVPIQPQSKLRVRDFCKINGVQDLAQDKEFKLIQLIISENPSLLTCNVTNRIKISRTKPNEFTILDDTYYYRTNKVCDKNYFFMNISQISRHNNEIIQRNYGIYWGDPRVSCMGVVETKGVLDEETKNFVFQQVKKSLFDEDGQQHVKLINVMQQPVKPILLRRSAVSTNIPAIIKPISMPTNEAEITNIDNETNKIDTIINVTKDGPKTTILKSIGPPLNTQNSTSPKVLAGNSKVTEVAQDAQQPNNQLINLYDHLSRGTRREINKLKYFEMYNGIVYTVTVGPKYSSIKDQPFNLIFTKNSKRSDVQPTPKDHHISRLVNDIFKAIYPNSSSSQRRSLLSSPPILPRTLKAITSIPAYPPKKAKSPKKPSKALSTPFPYDMTQHVKMLTPSEQAKIRHDSYSMPTMEKTFKLPSGKTIKIAKAKADTIIDSIGKSITTSASVNLPLSTIQSMPASDLPQLIPVRNASVNLPLSTIQSMSASDLPQLIPARNASVNLPLSTIQSMPASDLPQLIPARIAVSVQSPSMVLATSSLRRKKAKRQKVSPNGNTPQLCAMLPSSQTDNLLTNKSKKHKDNQTNGKRKHICRVCKESFERSYQLNRHLFVKHTANKTSQALSEATKNNSPSTLVVSINYTPKDQPNPEMPGPGTADQEIFSNDLEMKPVIKQEMDDDTYLNDKSLLVPLFEEPIKAAQNCQDDFLMVKCKEEPEENIAEITEMPVLLERPPELPENRGRKRKAAKKCREEETNSTFEIQPKVFDEESKKHLSEARKQSRKCLEEITQLPVLLKSQPALSKKQNSKRKISMKVVEKYSGEETESAPESSAAIKKYTQNIEASKKN